MLKGGKQSDTYLATICRHCWSAQMPIKKDNKLELSASTVVFIIFFITILMLLTMIKNILIRRKESDSSQVGVALFPSYQYIFDHFTFLGFPFILIILLTLPLFNSPMKSWLDNRQLMSHPEDRRQMNDHAISVNVANIIPKLLLVIFLKLPL